MGKIGSWLNIRRTNCSIHLNLLNASANTQRQVVDSYVSLVPATDCAFYKYLQVYDDIISGQW